MFTEPMMSELLNFARRRARAELDSPELEDLRNRADVVHGALYPGYGDPSAAECAVCAAGEIAFTSSPLKASSNALVFASKAVAKLAAESVGDMEYDAAFERKYGDERRSQLHLLQVRLKQLDL